MKIYKLHLVRDTYGKEDKYVFGKDKALEIFNKIVDEYWELEDNHRRLTDKEWQYALEDMEEENDGDETISVNKEKHTIILKEKGTNATVAVIFSVYVDPDDDEEEGNRECTALRHFAIHAWRMDELDVIE